MRVREILEQKVAQSVCSISSDEAVSSAARLMTDKNIGVLAVMDQEKLVGVVSERDILNKIVSKDQDPHRVTVREIMSTHLVVADLNESFEACEEKMRRAHCRHVLIVDSDTLVGLISLRDILDSSALERRKTVTIDEAMIWTMPAK